MRSLYWLSREREAARPRVSNAYWSCFASVELHVRGLEPAECVVAEIVVDAEAVALEPVVGREAERGRRADRRQHVGAHAPLHRFGGEPDRVARGRRQHELAEQRFRIDVLRVRRGAQRARRVVAAARVDLVAAPAVGDDHPLHAIVAARGRHGRADCGRPSRSSAGTKVIGFVVDRQQVARVLRDEVHCAGQAVAAVQRRGRPAQDLDALERVEIGVAAPASSGPNENAFGRRMPSSISSTRLPSRPRMLMLESPSRPPPSARCRPVRGAAHGDARLVAQRILDVGGLLFFQILVGDYRHGRRRAARGRGGAVGRDGDGIEQCRIAARGRGDEEGGRRVGACGVESA